MTETESPQTEPVTGEDAPGPEAQAADPTDTVKPTPRWRRWLTFSWSGLLGAMIFFCLSLTPSLLPRSALLQAVVGGILASIGYGLGVFARFCVRHLFDRVPSAQTMRISWWVLAGVSAVCMVTSLWLGAQWQDELHRLMGMSEPNDASPIAVVVGSALIGYLLLVIARGIRRFFRWVTRLASRRLPEKVSVAIGVVVTVVLIILVLQGVVFDTFVTVSNDMFSVANNNTPDGIERNPSPDISGGNGSLVAWDTLGREGRKFVAGGPTPEELTAFSGAPAQQPIRVYAGVESAPTIDERAQLVLEELDRTKAWDREAILVITTTGSGWVDPAGAYPIEYMYNGDTALASMQYSYLPSWISFLVDRSKASDAGRTLFNTVYQRWAELPEATRPKLLVYGESLGSFGTEAAFSGEADMSLRTDGLLLVGPPNANPLHREFTDDRDSGSPQWLPIYQDGRTIRFAADSPDFARPPAPWPGNRVAYLQHGSDPIVFWSPDLVLNEPAWLREAPAPDRSPAMRWYPFVTFFQVTVDMFFANGVPPGHGHRYGTLGADAWAQLAPPPGWTDAKTVELRAALVEQGWGAG